MSNLGLRNNWVFIVEKLLIKMLELIKSGGAKYFPSVFRFIRLMINGPSFSYTYLHRPAGLVSIAGITKCAGIKAPQLDDRLIASYLLRSNSPTGQWSEIFLSRHADIHDAIVSNSRSIIEGYLQDPGCSDLMYGFENNARSLHKKQRIEDDQTAALTLDSLIALAEAMGVRSLDNPERYSRNITKVHVFEVLNLVQSQLKFPLKIPNPFSREYGIICPGWGGAEGGAVMSYRVPQAIYQAWRVSLLVNLIPNPKIVEIGGGLGRTAFYARQFGITDYTIVDIPISSLAQGNFLGRVLGDESVCLHGEGNGASDQIKLISPETFFESSQRYDLVLNVDSLTEIGKPVAEEYWAAIQRRADVFLSINHEANEFSVAQLAIGSSLVGHKTRSPYWLRRGYVEEIFKFMN